MRRWTPDPSLKLRRYRYRSGAFPPSGACELLIEILPQFFTPDALPPASFVIEHQKRSVVSVRKVGQKLNAAQDATRVPLRMNEYVKCDGAYRKRLMPREKPFDRVFHILVGY